MSIRNFAGVLAVLAAVAGPVAAADWPSGPIQLVVPSRPGGGTDIMGRIFADYLQKATGTSVAVINQPAGGGTVAHEQVRTARPDGRTLLFQHTTLLVNNHTGRYDHGPEDFTILGIAQSYPPQVFAVASDAPWSSMSEFVEDARAHPGQRSIGVSLGGTTHFIAGELMAKEGIDLRMVESSAEVDKVAAIQGGFIDLGNLGIGSAEQFRDAGQMKLFCLLDPTPDPRRPEFRPCQDEGVDVVWLAPLIVWGPPGMDPALAEEINTAIRMMGEDPTVRERLEATDSSFRPYTLSEAHDLVMGEDAKIAELASRLGIGE